MQQSHSPWLSESHLIKVSSALTLSPICTTQFSNSAPTNTTEQEEHIPVLPQSPATLPAGLVSVSHHMLCVTAQPQGSSLCSGHRTTTACTAFLHPGFGAVPKAGLFQAGLTAGGKIQADQKAFTLQESALMVFL